MNLALHSLSGDIRLGNTYYDDLHKSVGKFDFVMANPPFNVDGVDKDKLAGDKHFPFGIPNPVNGNYLWIQAFYSALNEKGHRPAPIMFGAVVSCSSLILDRAVPCGGADTAILVLTPATP